MCGGISLLISYYLLGSLSCSLSFYVCKSKKISVCELGEENCTCVKKKYNGFWLISFRLYFA
jgi:hypothetical protein